MKSNPATAEHASPTQSETKNERCAKDGSCLLPVCKGERNVSSSVGSSWSGIASCPCVDRFGTRGQQPAEPQAAAKKQIYTCPMHPEIQWSRADKCPICDMKLVMKGARPAVEKGQHDHAGMSMPSNGMGHGHAGMGSMMMGCGCSMCVEMMEMGSTNGTATKAVSPVNRSGRPLYRSYSPRGGTGRCGC